jgi:hypothetical protein
LRAAIVHVSKNSGQCRRDRNLPSLMFAGRLNGR